MDITNVSVTIHEKKNHPHEFGHFDAGVTISADVESGENADKVLRELREQARGHVDDEIGLWLFEIDYERKQNNFTEEAQHCITHVENAWGRPDYVNEQRFGYAREALRAIRQIDDSNLAEDLAQHLREALKKSKPAPASEDKSDIPF